MDCPLSFSQKLLLIITIYTKHLLIKFVYDSYITFCIICSPFPSFLRKHRKRDRTEHESPFLCLNNFLFFRGRFVVRSWKTFKIF